MADESRIQEIPGNGGRIIDIGGLASEDDEEHYGGKSLIIFAVDPGLTTGWSALKVPVGLLAGASVARTLARCRWRHGQILRSAVGTGPLAEAVSDSRHTTDLFGVARTIYDEWVYETPDETEDPEGFATAEEEGWESDVFVWVLERFSLRMLSMDTNLLAPVRVMDRIVDRLFVAESPLPIFFQTPADAKTVVTDQRLRSWGMYDPSSGVHARDADRHAVLFLRKFAEDGKLRRVLGF